MSSYCIEGGWHEPSRELGINRDLSAPDWLASGYLHAAAAATHGVRASRGDEVTGEEMGEDEMIRREPERDAPGGQGGEGGPQLQRHIRE